MGSVRIQNHESGTHLCGPPLGSAGDCCSQISGVFLNTEFGEAGKEREGIWRHRADELHPTGNNNRSVFPSVRPATGQGPGAGRGGCERWPGPALAIPHPLWASAPSLATCTFPRPEAQHPLQPQSGQGQPWPGGWVLELGLHCLDCTVTHPVWPGTSLPSLLGPRMGIKIVSNSQDPCDH